MGKKLAIVAVGGNALINGDAGVSSADQYEVVSETAHYIIDMIEDGWQVVLTHGNGPQVGFVLRRSELASAEIPAQPLDYAVADTQGAIGYMFQKALTNELQRRKINQSVVTVVTQTLVSLDDPAFGKPSKPIGPFLDEVTAKERQEKLGWTIMEDAGRGWRRTVASPQPICVQELDVIRVLLNEGILVIACGGGGIPVAKSKNGELVGVEAVIDKDSVSTLLAKELNADLLLIPTGVEKVAINFGKPDEVWLSELTVEQAQTYYEQGEFGVGSMSPKVKAMINYIQANPKAKGLITSPASIKKALQGETGTWIRN